MEAILSYDDEVNDQEDVDNVLDGIIETFEVDKHGYVISEVRGMMNQSLADKGIGEICKSFLFSVFWSTICYCLNCF